MPRKWDIWLISLTHRVAIDRDYLIVLVIEDRRRRAGLQLHWTAQVCALLGFIHALHYILRFIGLYMVTCIAVQCVLIFCINDAASYCTAFACTHAFKQDKCFAVQKDCPSGGWHSAADSLSNGFFFLTLCSDASVAKILQRCCLHVAPVWQEYHCDVSRRIELAIVASGSFWLPLTWSPPWNFSSRSNIIFILTLTNDCPHPQKLHNTISSN